jgi:hypothetical protein
VLERALDVEAAAVGAGQDPGGGQVHRDAGHGDNQHRQAFDLRRRDQPPDRLVDDQGPQCHERRPVELGREDLRPPEAEGEVAAGGTAGEP